MPFHHHKDLKDILHPIIFVLKENKGIQKDLFDYSLWMMRVGSPEVIRAPKREKNHVGDLINEFDIIKSQLKSKSA